MKAVRSELAEDVRGSWHRFLDVYEPLRPELYRYCRYLTRSPWDAEDLVQDTMARAFVTLGCVFRLPQNPKAWLFRVASNLWIDRTRRAERERPGHVPEVAVEDEPRLDRDAATTLIGRLAPQERAAVVLKDAFGFTLAEVAEALSTTVGAVKAALHRGRGKLSDTEVSVPHPPPAPVLDAFVDAFNDRDLDRLTALLLDNGSSELVGVVVEYGPDAARDPETGSFVGFLSPITYDERGGVEPRHLVGYLPAAPRVEVRVFRDEAIVLFWYAHTDGEAVRTVARIQAADDRIASLRNYFFAPDVVADVCHELGVPFRTNGYRYWHPTTAATPPQ
jgi:RNA polymerase sigma-70 factor (ECF subfamily)